MFDHIEGADVKGRALCVGFQRIPGSSLSPSLQYFGRSVSARLDLDGDELIDLAVGAHGSAVLLRWGGKFLAFPERQQC